MTVETLKALLMIAMFGILEAALYSHTIRKVGHGLHQVLTETWHALALSGYVLQPVPVKRRRKH